MPEVEDHRVRPFSVLEIRRAIAHHRRAIEALHDRSSFQGIHLRTAERLIEALETDLRKLEDELGRRRMNDVRNMGQPDRKNGAMASISDERNISAFSKSFQGV